MKFLYKTYRNMIFTNLNLTQHFGFWLSVVIFIRRFVTNTTFWTNGWRGAMLCYDSERSDLQHMTQDCGKDTIRYILLWWQVLAPYKVTLTLILLVCCFLVSDKSFLDSHSCDDLQPTSCKWHGEYLIWIWFILFSVQSLSRLWIEISREWRWCM